MVSQSVSHCETSDHRVMNCIMAVHKFTDVARRRAADVLDAGNNTNHVRRTHLSLEVALIKIKRSFRKRQSNNLIARRTNCRKMYNVRGDRTSRATQKPVIVVL